MIYAMSDIHGCLGAYKAAMKRVDLSGESKLVLLGDYIDGGPDSGGVLRYIWNLQKRYGDEKVIALKGNHEQSFLDWISQYAHANPHILRERHFAESEWLLADSDAGLRTFRTLVPDESLARLAKTARTASWTEVNAAAAGMVLEENSELIGWMRKMPLYYEAGGLIFVHAGIDEEAGELWKAGTPDWMFLEKYPPTTGKSFKTIIAGHVGTCNEYLSNDPDFHGIYYDGESHCYIDGLVVQSGRIPVLVYGEKFKNYYEL